MAKVLGLGGIFFKANNPEKLAEWYRDYLGFDLSFPTGVSFNLEDLPQRGYQVWGSFKADTEYFLPSNKPFMFNLMVDNLEEIRAELEEKGCEVLAETESSEFGHFGWILDPEGNKVELWQPPAS
ncbi:VOC family protein [Aliikangiella sp. G2MR2-5]|uniref:VOC family protein n=1 Tax=Aliikangiella sp. G2MR2-5 TaxID=2788943 RepID=UPI0018ABFC75|nr:VOC family protein [Aliikangiella sp. G2MR2-5]